MSSPVKIIHAHESPWSHLLPCDILEFICSKISDIFDFAKFRCVCRSWRWAASPTNLSAQLPWLLLPYDYHTIDRPFYNFLTRSTCTLHLPEALDRIIMASSINGWLLLVDKSLNFNLLNPLTRAKIHLPPIITFPNRGRHLYAKVGDDFVCGYNFITDIRVELKSMNAYLRCYTFVSLNSTSQFDGVVVLVFEDCPQFLYWWSGDEMWTLLDSGFEGGIDILKFHKSQFYAIDFHREVSVCDLGSNSKGRVIPSLTLAQTLFRPYLVSTSKDLLLIAFSGCNNIHYYKLDETGEIMTWSKQGKLDNCSIFATRHQFTYVVRNDHAYTRNCLYVMPPRRETFEDGKIIYGIYTIGIRDGQKKEVRHLLTTCCANSHIQKVLLYVPSLC